MSHGKPSEQPARPRPSPLTSAQVARLARLGRGVEDPRSCEGLRPLVRKRPRDWDQVVRRVTPRPPTDLTHATLAQLLRSTANRRAMPRSSEQAESIRPYRLHSKLADQYLGARVTLQVSDQDLDELRNALRRATNDSGRAHAASTINGTVALVRGLVLATAAAAGVRPSVTRCPRRGGKRRGPARPRRTPSPRQVAALLPRCSPTVAAWIALVAGCGLRPGAAIGLRRANIVTEPSACVLLQVAPPRSSGRTSAAVMVAMPSWVQSLLLRAVPNLLPLPPEAPLFPRRGKPRSSRSVPRRELRRACEAAFGSDGVRFSGLDLRRLYQAMAIGHGLPRALVRGTGLITNKSQWGWEPHAGHHRTELLAQRWSELCGPATSVLRTVRRVPRRAPKGVGAWEPERAQHTARPRIPPLPRNVAPAPLPHPRTVAPNQPGIPQRSRGGPQAAQPPRSERVPGPPTPRSVSSQPRGGSPARALTVTRPEGPSEAEAPGLPKVLGAVDALTRRMDGMERALRKVATKADMTNAMSTRRPSPVNAQVIQQAERAGLFKGLALGATGAKFLEHRDKLPAAVLQFLDSAAGTPEETPEDPGLPPAAWGFSPKG